MRLRGLPPSGVPSIISYVGSPAGSIYGTIPGPRGPQGVQGNTGPTGPVGPKGDIGYTLAALFQSPKAVSTAGSGVVSTDSPGYTAQKTVSFTATSKFRLGGVLHSWLDNGWNAINGANNEDVPGWSSYEFEFWVDGQDVGFYTYAINFPTDFQITIDDAPVKMDWSSLPTANTPYYVCLHFDAPGVHRVRVLASASASLHSIVLPGASNIWPAGEERFTAAIIGDSFVQGPTTTSEGAIMAGALPGQLALHTGWNWANFGQGGTGYSNPGAGTTSKYGSPGRLAALAAYPRPLDLIVVFGGANDSGFGTYPKATTVANANALWTALGVAYPNVPLIVCGVEPGPLDPAQFSSANMDELNVALKVAAIAHPKVRQFIDMRTVPWVTGTGNAGTPTGDGSADFFTSNDKIHPNHGGYKLLAQRIIKELRGVHV